MIFPQRSDGYGISLKFCEKVVEDKNAVVVTVDNGITKIDEIKFLNDKNIPVLITDHHQPTEILPECPICDAFADKNSAGKHLCGAGIIWKVICLVDEFLKAKNYNFSKKYMSPEKFIPYVAIGTIGDMMPFTTENLAIIKVGLEMLRQHKVKTLDVLFKSGLFGSTEVNVRNIAFGLNSMMNACSRMGEIEKACNLFFLENASEDEIYAYGQEMKKLNEKRKAESKKAVQYVLENYAPKAEDKIIVAEIGDSTFGIAGIAAAKLVEKFNLPVCIYKKCDSEIISASVRSIEGLNILDCLKAEKIKGNIQDFGGHNEACGAQLFTDKIENFKQDLNSALQKIDFKSTQENFIDIDAVITCGEINKTLRAEINSLPYDNSKFKNPVFCLKNVSVTADKPSKGKEHIQYDFQDDTGEISTVEWNGYSRYKEIGQPKKVNVVFSSENFGLNCYNKRSDDINLKILDIKAA